MNRPDTFSRRLREHAINRLADGPLHIDEVVAEAIATHADLFAAEGDRLARKAADRIVKDVMRRLGEDDDTDETRLPGLSLPSVIYVDPGDAEPYYRRTDLATWAEIEAGLAERQRNAERAQARIDRYLDGMDRLRPIMADDPAVTVGEALRRELGKAA